MATTIRVAIEGNAKTEIEAIRQRLKQVQSGLKDVNREISETMRTGGQVSADLTARFKTASNEQNKLRELIRENNRQQRETVRIKQDQHTQAIATLRATHAISRIANSPLVRNFLSGQKVSVSDVMRTAVQSEKLVNAAGKMVGLGKLAASGELHPLIMAAEFGATIGTQIRENMDKKIEFRENLQRAISRGDASSGQTKLFDAKEGNAFQSFLGSALGKTAGQDAVEANTSMSKSLVELLKPNKDHNSEDNFNAVLGALNASTREKHANGILNQIGLKGGFDQTPEQFQKLFKDNKGKTETFFAEYNARVKAREDQLGVSVLSDKDKQLIAEDSLSWLQRNGSIEARDAEYINKAVADRKKWDEIHKEDDGPSKQFREREMKTQSELQFQLRHKRFESAPTD